MAKRRRRKKGPSKFENKVAKCLDEYGVSYEREKTFPGLVGERLGLLRYDFYIEEIGCLIEVHGKQHYEMTPYFHKSMADFRRQRERDISKEQFAIDNELQLVIISYEHENDIAEIIEHTIMSQL
jgi:hypothetical protein